MRHQHRVRMRAWFARRKDYGTSAAILELRHPGAVRPLYVSGWTALAWLAAACGRPDAGAAVTGASIALLARRLARVTGEEWPWPSARASWRLAVQLAGGGTLMAGRPLGSAISRTWWPVALPVAIAVRRLRLPLAALALAPPLLDWLDRRPPLDPGRYVIARLLDDIAYSLGVWQGCAELRTARPLLPLVGTGRQPPPASPLPLPAVPGPHLGSPWEKSAGTIMSSPDRSRTASRRQASFGRLVGHEFIGVIRASVTRLPAPATARLARSGPRRVAARPPRPRSTGGR